MSFPHEHLIAYRVALEVAIWLRQARWPANSRSLKDQGLRASESMVLNIAEGAARGGASGRNHLQIAQASAAELCAVLDLAQLRDCTTRQEQLRRVERLVHGLKR